MNIYREAYRQMLIEELGGDSNGAPAGVAGSSAQYMQQFKDNPQTAAYTPAILIPIAKRRLSDYTDLKEGCENCNCENCKSQSIEEKCKKHLIEFLSEVFHVEEYETEEMDDELKEECMMLRLTRKDDTNTPAPTPNQTTQQPNTQQPNTQNNSINKITDTNIQQ